MKTYCGIDCCKDCDDCCDCKDCCDCGNDCSSNQDCQIVWIVVRLVNSFLLI